VIHLANEQPLLADLFALPAPTDATLMCTNVRTMTGKRPVWADHVESVFYFPWSQIRFLEVPPEAGGRQPPSAAPEAPGTDLALRPESDEAELEIDEEFLRRVRDV
jgi:hypothetical protein